MQTSCVRLSIWNAHIDALDNHNVICGYFVLVVHSMKRSAATARKGAAHRFYTQRLTCGATQCSKEALAASSRVSCL